MAENRKRIAKSVAFTIAGFLFGILAPVFWTVLRLVLFFNSELSLATQIFGDITKDAYSMALYSYMGIGTAVVMACLGFVIGRNADDKDRQALELKVLHKEVASQKEIFENRYLVLDNNIKNFHQISHRIQRSNDFREVLRLCAEGLHDILGYERVNILLADPATKTLSFVAATGSEGFNPQGVTIPLDERGGIIYKSFSEKKLYLVDDISTYSSDYYLKPPYDTIRPLRSRSFVLCPIVVRGESVGLFGIDNKFSYRSLNDTDVATVKLFADQASLALTRINLLQAINTLVRELDTTFSSLLTRRDEYSRTVYHLRNGVASLAEVTTSIASAAESVMTAVGDANVSINEISHSTDQVAFSIESLSEHIDKSVSAVEEMNATIKHVKEGAAVSHTVSSEVQSQAQSGSRVVSQAIDALSEIQQDVERSAVAITLLSENSTRIEGIIEVINEITKRTNLLALNASIIAAQAGEYGKSFGVVADEIRNLSLQTGRSTEEITSIIDEIMGDSRTAADSIANTKNHVQQGVYLGQQAGSALAVIVGSAGRAMDKTQEIKQATEEQARSIQLITRSMEDISSMTSQISSSSREQSSSTRAIVGSIGTVKEMTQQMAKSTGRQSSESATIRDSVEQASLMTLSLFDSIESRRTESQQVVTELEAMTAGGE